MCGIVGIIGNQPVAPLLIEGLRRLEYRGYDSAGIATLRDGSIERRRAEGKISSLEAKLNEQPVKGSIGIGHTRWATHGVPSETNAHPHATSNVAVVHNGIIENFQELREELSGHGYQFLTDTDTEVIAHLVGHHLKQGADPRKAVACSLPRLEGAFAIVLIFAGEQDLMIGARLGSPLAIGYGNGEMYIGSDALALAPLTQQLCYLEDGDWAIIKREGPKIFDHNDEPVSRPVVQTAMSGAMIGKGDFRHFMLKEIYEQPTVIGETLNTMLNPATRSITLPPLPIDFGNISRISISACGTAYYAGLVGKYWIERLGRLPVELDVASEFRYREVPMQSGGLSIFISQSGETMDTLSALQYAAQKRQKIVSIVNVDESSITRASDAILRTMAGPEIGVASTKAFTTQLTVIACLAIACGRARGTLSETEESTLSLALSEVPGRAAEILKNGEAIAEIAETIADARDVLYLGRGTSYAIALEGALKLKEISYIHAEGYAAGEMKHGPIALIDENVPVIVIAPGNDPLFEKTASNMQEVIARGGRVVLISDKDGASRLGAHSSPHSTIILPQVNPFVAPILYSIPVQLLAYHTAIIKGTDVDQPRNLAKSVTVE